MKKIGTKVKTKTKKIVNEIFSIKYFSFLFSFSIFKSSLFSLFLL